MKSIDIGVRPLYDRRNDYKSKVKLASMSETESDNTSDNINKPPVPNESPLVEIPVFAEERGIPLPIPKPSPEPNWKILLLTLVFIWMVEVSLQFFMIGTWVGYKLIGGGYFVFGIDSIDIQNIMNTVPLEALLIVHFLTWTAAILICALFMKSNYQQRFSDVFGFSRVPLNAYVQGFGISILGIFFISVVSQFMGETDDAPITDIMFKTDSEGNPIGVAIPMILLALSAPLVEEMYYRGFLYSAFRGLLGTNMAFILIIVWFAAIHAIQVGGNVAALSVIMYMGAMWTWLRHKYNSILPGMFSHFVYNGTLIGITMLALKLQSVFGDSGIGVE